MCLENDPFETFVQMLKLLKNVPKVEVLPNADFRLKETGICLSEPDPSFYSNVPTPPAECPMISRVLKCPKTFKILIPKPFLELILRENFPGIRKTRFWPGKGNKNDIIPRPAVSSRCL
jgi:hypothetical protein